jgi:23S rRNA pseudouridine955/2504/2580 synthase
MSPKIKFSDWIIFEDDDYIAINKPPYISTLEDRSSPIQVLGLAKTYWPDAQVCHRLDKETSGVLLIAKTPEAYRNAAIQFEKRQVKKVYRAVVDGIHDFRAEAIDLPILAAGSGPVKISHREGKPATTIVTTLDAYKDQTLVACEPLTGRMHQIRVHLAAKNASIVDDTMYGGRTFYLSSIKRKFKLKEGTEEEPLIKRVALHAYSLGIKDINGQEMLLEAPYPKDFNVLVKQLEKFR